MVDDAAEYFDWTCRKVERRTGVKWVATLPDGYSSPKLQLADFDGFIVVVHPDRPPLKVMPDGTVELIKFEPVP